jgi:hypothetical protein
MSALTRILNNQIYSKTIIASQKIADGTITGSLFSSNVTVPGDFLITGNLFVLGTSAYTTIASTNTYVNDPLIVLNNGFAGTNTYDEGFIFNRGSLQNRALIWSEFNQEFRLIGTTETGTAYGNVAVSNYVNIHVGNLISDYNANVGSLTSAGGINGVNAILSGDLAVDGGDITTAQSMGNVFNANATSISAFGAATGILLGATSGTLLVNNPTIVGSQTTQNIFNANATTVNAFGAATAITIGANSGFTAIQNGNIWVPNATSIDGAQTTVALLNTNATTINAFGAATTLNLGASSGIATVNNTTVYLPTATNIAVGGASLTFANTVVATVNAFGSATSTFLGATGGIVTARDALAATGTFWANSSASTTTQGTGAVIVPNGGISVAGAANIGSTVTVAGATQLNSTLGVGGITTFTNSTNATSIADGAVRIQGGASVSKDLYVGGNLYAANIVGITANVITVEDPLLFLKPSYTFPYNYDIGIYSSFQGAGLTTAGNVLQHTGVIRHQETNTWTFASNLAEPGGGHVVFDNNTVYDPIKAGNLELTVTTDSTSASTGALIVAGGAGIGGNIFHTGTQLQTSAGNYIFATTPTVVDAFTAASTLNIGATSGTITLGNPTVVGTQATQALYNTVTDTLNFARAANITMGHTDGTTTLQGNANVRAVTNGITFTQGALISAGAVGVAGNLNIKGNSRVTIGTDLVGSIVYPENQVQAAFNGEGPQRIAITNLNASGQSEFSAIADNGSNIARFVSTGITNSGFGSGFAFGAGDAYTYVNLGNLYLGSSDYDVGILAGGLYSNSLVARFSTVSSNISFYSSRVATSATQAAFTVAGGAGISGNLYVARGAVFNSGLSTDTFQIKSSTSGNVALFANLSAGPGTSESVIIGGANTVVQSGVTLKVNSTTSMMVPVGPTSSRPSSVFGAGYDVAGMMRFNNTINNLEFYDGTNWAAAGSTFTVISDRQFAGNVAGGFGNVDGTNTAFTLQANSTTAGTIVSINGVMQFPTLAYSITGATMTFTEPPAPGDVIDARIITTTTTVSTLASGNGLNQFIAADSGAQIWTGTSSTTQRIEVDTSGNFNFLTGNKVTYDQTVVSVPNTNLTLLDSFSANSYTTSKYVISMKQGTGNVQAMEALLTQSTVGSTAGTAYVTTYGIVNTGNTMGTLAANVDVSGSWTVKLWLIPNAGTAISNVKVMTTYIV